MDTAQLISQMAERIVHDFHPLQIILFGSQSRGESNLHSDVDLLVVFSQVTDKRQSAIQIRRALADFPVAKDILVTTPAEISRAGKVIGTTLHTALSEGTVLYDRK